MARTSRYIWDLFALVLLLQTVYAKREVNCTEAPKDVMVLIDITAENDDTFAQNRQRIIDTLRYIDEQSPYKKLAYGVIAFHKRPLVLLPLTSPLSRYNQKVIEYIQSLKSRRKFPTSPAKALELAAEHFANFGSKDACLLTILADDGNSTDLADESIQAKKHINDQGGRIFAIATSEQPDIDALTGYTEARNRVYFDESDKSKFIHEISRVIGACNDTEEAANDTKSSGEPHSIVSISAKINADLNGTDACKSNLIDLVILLDTSGSVNSSFDEQREFVTNLVSAIEAPSFEDDRLHISVIQFASTPNVTISLQSGYSKDEVLKRINEIEFTGESTLICDAIDLGLTEVQQFRRSAATGVFILVSDGRGQDYWSVVQETRKRLHQTGMETFAVSATSDYNLDELTLYGGSADRVYVNPNHTEFLKLVTNAMNICLNKGIENVGTVEKIIVFTPSPPQPPVETTTVQSVPSRGGDSLGSTQNIAAIEVVPASLEVPKSRLEIPRVFLHKNGRGKPAPKVNTPLDTKPVPSSSTVPSVAETVSPVTQNPNDATEKTMAATPVTNEIDNHRTEDGVADRDVFTELIIKNFNKTSDHTVSDDSAGNKTGTEPNVPKNGTDVELETSNTVLPVMTTMTANVSEENIPNEGTKNGGTTVIAFVDHSETVAPESEAGNAAAAGVATSAPHLEHFINKVTSNESGIADTGKDKLSNVGTNEGCKIDLVLVIDRSKANETIFNSRIQFAKNLVERLLAKKDNMKTLQIGVVSFATDAKVELEFGLDRSVDVINKEIAAIKGDTGEVSLVSGIALATKFIQSTRRPNADVVMFLVSDGKAPDSQEMIMKETSALHSVPKSHFYAVTFDEANAPEYIEKLALFIGNKSEVYVEHASKPFIRQAETIIDKCMWNVDIENTTMLEDVGNKSSNQLSKCTPVDLIIMIDRTAYIQDEFNKVKVTAIELLKSITPDLFNDYVKAALISYDSEPNVERSLEKPTSQEQLIETVMGLSQVNTSSSVSKAVSKVVDEIRKNRRPDSRLVIVVFTDDGIKSCSSSNRQVVEELHKFQGEVYGVYQSPINGQIELSKNNGSNERIVRNEDEVTYKKISINPCKDSDFNNTTLAVPTTEAEGTPSTSVLLSACAALPNTEPPKELPVDPNCLVDLMFIIDRSQSVEEEFQDQLSFAVDMVKRIRPDDLLDRVRVSAVSFARSSKVEFSFGEFHNKTELLHALISIPHTGGSTSTAKGVNMAVDELQKNARPNARQMVVLISDGNSQDQWKDVLAAADRLHETSAEVYAVTVSHEYFLRELELYAKSKWFVYIDARIRQFLDQAELSVSQCLSPEFPTTKLPAKTVTPEVEENEDYVTSTLSFAQQQESSKHLECMEDPVDVMFVLDTSSSIEDAFYAEKNFAIDLVKGFPEIALEDRIRVGLVTFAGEAKLRLELGGMKSKSDILYELDRVEYTGGQTSLAAGANEVLKEIALRHRSNARLIVIFISDGNSQDLWQVVQSTAKKLRETGAEVYAVTLLKSYALDELKEYTGAEDHIYVNDRIKNFIEDVGFSVMVCNTKVDTSTESAPMSMATNDSETMLPIDSAIAFSTDPNDKCKYSKMDLEIILDASTSRQDVFERQRELALSLIERLPIGYNDTHVALGIISFSDAPALRLPLGLGRDKQAIRKELENIEYRGGSTLTARAIELSVHDLERGHRPDAIKVLVLMNDGLSQDPWDEVLRASDKLRAAVSERFGVALGQEIDLRELRRYIGSDERIYRDDETERFLHDVVALTTEGKDCEVPVQRPVPESSSTPATDDCDLPNLDLAVVFDNSDGTANLTDPSISLNRFLLLDVLGSLPDTWDSGKLKLSLISFADEPKLTVSFTDNQSREQIFKKVEGIAAQHGRANYAKAVDFAVGEYEKYHRSDARGLLLIVGDGHSYDSPEQRESVMNLLDKHMELLILAVDSGNNLDVQNLAMYTSSPELVYNYEKNAEFVRDVLKEASAPEGCEKKTASSPSSTRVPQQDVVTKTSMDSFKELESSKVIVKTKDTEVISKPTSVKNIPIISEKLTTTSTTKASKRPTTPLFSTRKSNSFATTTKKPFTPTAVPRKSTLLTRLNNAFSTRALSTTTTTPEDTTPSVPGCMLDVLFIIDASGSVQETFERQKELAAKIIDEIRIGEDNAHVALIKFAAEEKVKTVWSFGQAQSKRLVLRALKSLSFSSGVTAIDKALLQAVDEYDAEGRPGEAIPIGIIFTDGFGQKDTSEAAKELRSMVPNMFAVAINHQYPINRPELENITGSADRVYTDANITQLYAEIRKFAKDC